MFYSFLTHNTEWNFVFNKVEDYYEIIKEPMDFGTMRAKLHEGMYKNLEQFEVGLFSNLLLVFSSNYDFVFHLQNTAPPLLVDVQKLTCLIVIFLKVCGCHVCEWSANSMLNILFSLYINW